MIFVLLGLVVENGEGKLMWLEIWQGHYWPGEMAGRWRVLEVKGVPKMVLAGCWRCSNQI